MVSLLFYFGRLLKNSINGYARPISITGQALLDIPMEISAGMTKRAGMISSGIY